MLRINAASKALCSRHHIIIGSRMMFSSSPTFRNRGGAPSGVVYRTMSASSSASSLSSSTLLFSSTAATSSTSSLLTRFSSATAMQTSRRYAASSSTFLSREFFAATKDVPLTPGGKNPYELLEMPITKATTLDDISKQRRELVQKYHPDAPGGSTERMAEINAAHAIIKDNHGSVIKRFHEVESSAKANQAYRQHRDARKTRDEDLGRNGGVQRRNVRAMNEDPAKRPPARNQKEIEAQWETFRAETESTVTSMCRRYELASEQSRYFRKSSVMTEIQVRERWLRKSYIKGVWEDVHEMRGELLRRGARNAQQSQLAEEMVAFAGSIQRKLNDDFVRLTQLNASNLSRMWMQRILGVFIVFYLTIACFKGFGKFAFYNSMTARYRSAMLGY